MDGAIEKTIEYLLARFQPARRLKHGESPPLSTLGEQRRRPVMIGEGGYWMGELEADTTLESDYILLLYFLEPDAHGEKIRKLANYVREHQLEDGSWNIYYGGPGDLSASVKAYFALKLAGASTSEPFMQKAREWILQNGGADNVNNYTKIYLSFLNQYDWDEIPALPPEIILLPRFFYFNIYEISYWSRAILIPLSILYAKKVNRPVSPDVSIREIFTNGLEASQNGNGYAGSAEGGSAEGGSAEGGSAEGGSAEGGSAEGGSAEGGSAESGGNGAGNGRLLAAAGDASQILDELDGAGHGALIAGRHCGANGGGAIKPRSANGTRPAGANGSSGSPEMNGDRKGSESNGKTLWDPNLLSWRNFFTLVDRILRLIEKSPLKPLRSLALRRAEKWMVQRTEKSDGLGAIFPSMVNSIMAMRSLGYDEDHPTLATSIAKLRELEIEEGESIRLQPCLSPVWDTVLVMNALSEAHVPSETPEMVEAARWVVSKEVRQPGDWWMRVRDVEVSGWYFQFQNEFYPDIDDTAAVLLALDRCDPKQVEGLQDALTRGVNWILKMQCSDGGWAAFDVNIDHEVLTKVPYADHNAMLDPACADITGRVLEMLGRFPHLRDDARVERAIRGGVEYLKGTQCDDGSWYGRWGVNYIYGTWQALKGLIAVGEDPQAPYIRRSVDWLKDCQNDDGGWGETCESYADASLKGRGASTASQTAWAVMGLVSTGDVDSPAVARGIDYLLRTQTPDGTWDEKEYTGTGFPDVFYLRYHLYRTTFPLFALAYYRNVKQGIRPAEGTPIELPRWRGGLSLRGLRDGIFGR